MSGSCNELVATLSQSSIPDLASVDQILYAHLHEIEKGSPSDDAASPNLVGSEAMEHSISGTGEEDMATEQDLYFTPASNFASTTIQSSFTATNEPPPAPNHSMSDVPAPIPTTAPASLNPSSFGTLLYTSSHHDEPFPNHLLSHLPGLTEATNDLFPGLPEFPYPWQQHPGFPTLPWSVDSTASTSPTFTQTFTFDPQPIDEPIENGAVPDYARNVCVREFVDKWAYAGGMISVGAPDRSAFTKIKLSSRPETITEDDLALEPIDVQGINWGLLRTTRTNARRARKELFRHKLPELPVHRKLSRPSDSGHFFAFRRTLTQHQPFINHYQLRNLLTVTSSNDVYYASGPRRRSKIVRVNSQNDSECVMETSNPFGPFGTTCLCSSDDVLVAGSFEGTYAYKYLDAELGGGHVYGSITNQANGITNHIHAFKDRRNLKTQAAFCSNDQHMRILDCASNTFTANFAYDFMINCAATCPDGQLRLVVGDRNIDGEHGSQTLITRADTGEIIHAMRHHVDDSFACAWADDGITFATGAQDSLVHIYDARNWQSPVTTIVSELGVPRILGFSPLGGGARKLFIAEAEDNVTVVDASSYRYCQVLHSFGSLAGMSLSPDGERLWVANSDRDFYGLLEYEKSDWANGTNIPSTTEPWDWAHEIDIVRRPEAMRSFGRRHGFGVGHDMLL